MHHGEVKYHECIPGCNRRCTETQTDTTVILERKVVTAGTRDCDYWNAKLVLLEHGTGTLEPKAGTTGTWDWNTRA